jgi:hypothetical protein
MYVQGLWILVDSLATSSPFYYWKTPGLYVFSFIGGILVFKIMWVMCVWAWSSYHVNYIELFRTPDAHVINKHKNTEYNQRPNVVHIISHTMDLLMAFMACLVFFYRANTLLANNIHAHIALQYVAPLVLLILFVLYIVYNLAPRKFHVYGMEYPSTNLFAADVLRRNFCAPYYRVCFLDNFSADAMTSFTRIISDCLHAMCWIVSGSFTNPSMTQSTSKYGSSQMMCAPNDTMTLVVGLFMIVPLWVRFVQCMRNYYDNIDFKQRKLHPFPHVFNAIKYMLSILVVIYGVFLVQFNSFYYFLIVFTTIYKWLWDVCVDWGLCSTFMKLGFVKFWKTPFKDRMLLRPHLMYERRVYYYIAIVIDLILRFVWVLSLAPASVTAKLAQSALQAFMGALEIIRRGIWGIFRVENEHVNKLYGHALGVLIEKKSVTNEHSNYVMAEARLRSASIQSLQSLQTSGSMHSIAGEQTTMTTGYQGFGRNKPSAMELQLMRDPAVTGSESQKEASFRLASAAGSLDNYSSALQSSVPVLSTCYRGCVGDYNYMFIKHHRDSDEEFSARRMPSEDSNRLIGARSRRSDSSASKTGAGYELTSASQK